MATLAALSPFVIGTRVTRMWFAFATAPTMKDKREAMEMVSEKVEATGEAIIAMNNALTLAAGEVALAAVSGRHRSTNDVDAVVAAGLKPFTTKLKSNHRRLSK
ncbi:hypothetical protein [Jiella marina]|uniref:hypothetical protein n=1 Tax=Jiella sp. LLJ827 TaxID=2917712 RepID=UPI002100D4A4|nr:hypothetical protein [Jiella sp. LLJ827]MCQ0988116.1 hypothetical protein [Jiella sp. LLJ827]